MRVTEKNLEHTKEVLNRIYFNLNRFYMNSGASLPVQINEAQNVVNCLERDYLELECDLTGMDDYMSQQEKLMEQDTVIVEEPEILA